MTNDTFEKLWSSVLEAKATTLGIKDGDIEHVRASVKATLVDAGWVQPSGEASFVSAQDKRNCLTAAAQQMEVLAPNLVAQSKVTRQQVINASTTTEFTGTSVHASLPGMANVGDRCTRCSGTMEVVGMVNDRAGLYCSRDRVVLPLPVGTALR